MKYLITALLTVLFTTTYAQVQPFGQIDTADLRLTSCSFEKSANAMVLFDRGELICKEYNNQLIRHKRIKIFNDKGKDEANIRLEYISKNSYEDITDVVAQTINMEGKVIKITSVDKGQIFIEKIDKYRKALVFAFPQVRAGSVIEIQYKWKTNFPNHFPKWFFQGDIPVRYSELVAGLRGNTGGFSTVKQPFAKNTTDTLKGKERPMTTRKTWALANVHSFVTEPFMAQDDIVIQSMAFFRSADNSTWEDMASRAIYDEDFGLQLKQPLPKTDSIMSVVAKQTSEDKKVQTIFNYVKSKMLWNNTDNWFTEDGIKRAWAKKTGNSTEINLVLYQLLNKAGIKGLPVLVSTPANGKVEVKHPALYQFDKTVVFVPVDSTSYYILDASNKKQLYSEIPYELLNTRGLLINMPDDMVTLEPKGVQGTLFTLTCFKQVNEQINTIAKIKGDGKMEGNVQIKNFSYGRAFVIALKDNLGAKYADVLKNNDDNININELKYENLETDTLPLLQRFNFAMDLPQSDGDYLFFNTNLFSNYRINPFLSNERFSDIEFPSPVNCSMIGQYSIPPDYKIETLPKNIHLKTDDGGIEVRRIMVYEGNIVGARYIMKRAKSFYTKEEYPALKEFYKKLFEVLNEPVILKKL